NAITFLLIIPLALVFFAKQTWVQALKNTLPFLGAAILFLVLRGQVIGWSFGDAPRELLNNPFLKIVGNQYVDFSPGEKLATILFTLGKYAQLLFFPHPLTHDYYPRHIDIMHFGDWQVLLSLVFYLTLFALAIAGFRKRKVWAFGVLYYLITLSIVSNIVFPIGTNMSERFMYMPSLGWSIALGSLFVYLLDYNKNLVWIILGCVALALSMRTVMRNPVWKDNYTLFTTDIQTSQKSAKLLAATGGELVTQFGTKPQSPERDTHLHEALDYLHRAQAIHPNYKLSYLLEGNAQFYLKNWDESIAAYQRVLALSPDDADAKRNLGIAYRDAGRYFGEQQNDVMKAIKYLSEAIKILPDDYETVHAMGVAYGIGGNPVQAINYFKRGVELQPDNATAHFNLGLAYQRVGDTINAQKHRDHAVALDPQILERRKSGGQ
ncbi:MAG TPA: tetratricopeptide repeat protein, partial [Saprospiraceae bacterium]|nr:tetratricopeptide repeat protein [Saprospiraceae bacterium]